MRKHQAVGWIGAALCSIALVVAGGLMLSSFAVNRYLQATSSALHRGEAADAGSTPDPAEFAEIERLVTTITTMPGVATASSDVDTPVSASPRPVLRASAPPVASNGFSYDVSVIMKPDASPSQTTGVVFAMTKQLQNARVNLELSVPAGDDHATAVIDYRHAFDAPVARATVDSVSQAVAVAAAVPGVESVHVTVPYTWNLASGDLAVEFTTDDSGHNAALKQALERTALSGVSWTGSH